MRWAEKNFGKILVEKMTEKENISNLEDSLPMVSYIMLHRIYDMLALMAKHVAPSEDVEKMIQYHEAGYLLGPAPSYTPGENND